MESVVKGFGLATLVIILIVFVSFLMAFPVMWLVNALIVPKVLVSIFGTSTLSFWQSLGLNLLCGILFKGSCSSSK